MSHSLAWMVFLPTAHCGSHDHELPTTPSSLDHLSHAWQYMLGRDTSTTTN